MRYGYDEYTSRNNTDSLTVDGGQDYLLGGYSDFLIRYSGEENIESNLQK